MAASACMSEVLCMYVWRMEVEWFPRMIKHIVIVQKNHQLNMPNSPLLVDEGNQLTHLWLFLC